MDKYVITAGTAGYGEVFINNGKIAKFNFYFNKSLNMDVSRNRPYIVNKLEQDIRDYFKGIKVNFLKYELDFSRLSQFERNILEQLRKIGYGEVISYSKLGEKAGYYKAARAVGRVMKKNPFPIIIPCHRVVKSNGDIGEYTPGKKYKTQLLLLESALYKV